MAKAKYNLNITRLECKVIPVYFFLSGLADLNITRLECKATTNIKGKELSTI